MYRPEVYGLVGVINSRDYTGNNDGRADGQRAGTNEFIKQMMLRCPSLHNLGSFTVRDKRSSPGSLSVHATGRAWDAGYPLGRIKRLKARRFINQCVRSANTLGIELVIDYFPQKHGVAWRCDRQAWKVFAEHTVTGAPGGRWFHIEINPVMANSPATVKVVFDLVFGRLKR